MNCIWTSDSSIVYTQHVNLEEIKPALVSTFSLLHEGGLVSEYDDQFVEQFAQTLQRELAHQCR